MNKVVGSIVIFLLSCSAEPLLKGFNSEKWQGDELGCNNQRLELVDEIKNRKAELVGLSENEISSILGKPNRHELYSRNKKAYVYYIKGGPDCSEKMDNPKKLVIRFNGVGLSKEIILYKK